MCRPASPTATCTPAAKALATLLGHTPTPRGRRCVGRVEELLFGHFILNLDTHTLNSTTALPRCPPELAKHHLPAVLPRGGGVELWDERQRRTVVPFPVRTSTPRGVRYHDKPNERTI